MDAHIANETKFQLDYDRSKTNFIVHIIIPKKCLSEAGIDLSKFTKPKLNLSGVIENSVNLSPPTFRVLTQTRFHASGKCTPWEPVFACYLNNGALYSILIPTNPTNHNQLFKGLPDVGGLFVTLEIVCDTDGLFDAFTVVAIRVDMFGQVKNFEILFTYDELIPSGTRYGADAPRIANICKQFSDYVKCHKNITERAVTAGSHIEACMGDEKLFEDTQNISYGSILKPYEILYNGGFDNPETILRLEENDKEIMSLIRRASEVIANRNPVRSHNSTKRFEGRQVIASGLIQGAKGISFNNRTSSNISIRGHSSSENTSCNFLGNHSIAYSNQNSMENLDDILIVSNEAKVPLTPLDWLDVGHASLLNGDTISDIWRRRPISIVARKHYSTGETFIVVSYENSIGWGGKRFKKNTDLSLSKIISSECVSEGVTNPRDLPDDIKNRLITEHPILTIPLGKNIPPMSAFDSAAEVELIEKFKDVCNKALITSITESLRLHPRMSQLFEYELHEKQHECIIKIANQAPELLKALLASIEHIPSKDFRNGSLMLNALSYLNYTTSGKNGYIPYNQSCFSGLVGGKSVFLFDYFSSGGAVIKVSDEPIPILIKQNSNGQHRCSFVKGKFSTGNKTYERFLPGECYAYICVGFNNTLDGIIVFPGGFAFKIYPSIFFDWPEKLKEAILSRFCWTI
ncbi:DNA packaging tegument protein UL17 [Canid alphaherpesvirus 1]|uniref:DNA packaging tegument protein UL17 n=1 Tax=Canid alphaherpesvirus 1 TaxID=170325 RepID=A0A172DSJ8_9ALPH|nr:DNA packaging tegument protein UL17 [Canid alphaherpesvirus 1]ALL26000.1 DNA packaging tegument protein UL17 [Canid alphaherpesvirus 1]ARE29847.1 DNA packaging tegument protein UL17 [Canid alphaherpesvirus 1]QQL08505.1 DNA packaging tegument protein UL17 [Canid alphaherpesvirus 1]QQL08580.1 DNA packaging tegument protein UL17 [Canid alphaherpesvirus 1]